MEKQQYSNHNVQRYISLTILTLQTTMTVLVMRYSRTESEGKELYINTTVVLLSEVVKLAFCLILLFGQHWSLIQTAKVINSEVIRKPYETTKLAIPSTLYTIQSNLILVSLSNLDAATFQVTYQLKILTTAFFSVILLRKDIKLMQWVALVILMFGIVFVQFPSASKDDGSGGSAPMTTHRLIGLVAVLTASLSSGFAGVFYEKLLKEGSQPSVIIRNIQLGIFSVIFGAVGVFVNDLNKVKERGFFDGYSPVVWVVIFLQAFGGLVVAAVIKYADNILKGFATSVSIILSCLFSYVVFNDLQLQPSFILGTAMVIGATFIYGMQSISPSNTPAAADSKFSNKASAERSSPRSSDGDV